jgi:hypothetical protein
VLLPECSLRCERVRADAHHAGACGFQLRSDLLEALHLDRSPAGESHRIERHDDDLAPQIVVRHLFPVHVSQRELGHAVAYLQHRARLLSR